ncbi:hypothetical protein MSAN_00589300 [Mycena sanguinolenta]|uniref:Uncharacterized protein n=1 Tax=Mycena sanguinolenta TaxID=230812 RepID=A0A8H6ZCI4_9AGAR|nr:hypothetical protein MSAN_00589300 [Mycena sanguinolenta]
MAASSSVTTSSATSTSNRKCAREPLANVENAASTVTTPSADASVESTIDLSTAPPSPKPYDDELLPPPTKRSRNSRTTIDINSDEEENEVKPSKSNRHDRSVSASSSSGGRRSSRTTEAGNQIARGLKSIGDGMSAPLITKADTSHVDEVIDVFTADPTLLPR